MTEATHLTRHPLTPPLTEDERLCWLRLLRSRRVGVTTFYRLMDEHGSAAAARSALPDGARAAGVSDYRTCPAETAEAEMQAARYAGARMIARGEPDYPAALLDLADAPPLLWTIGDCDLLSRPAIALVGARSASSLGRRMARRMAEDLSEAGYVVVSGLARGIDAEAHAAAMPGGTVAVLAGGVDVVYPAENAVLAQEIAERGLRVSEQPMGMAPQARHFPKRNRIVSGLARAVVVIEAASKSGTLITARNALDQGRDVLAVPGHPFDGRAAGCNMLIRDGATLVRSAADVIEALAPLADHAEPAHLAIPPDSSAWDAAVAESLARSGESRTIPAPPGSAPADRRGQSETRELHRMILERLGPSPLAEDQLIRDLALPAGDVARTLLTLELEGEVERQPGGLLARLQ